MYLLCKFNSSTLFNSKDVYSKAISFINWTCFVSLFIHANYLILSNIQQICCRHLLKQLCKYMDNLKRMKFSFWQKDFFFIMSNFSFCHNVTKGLLETHQNASTCGKGLTIELIWKLFFMHATLIKMSFNIPEADIFDYIVGKNYE